MVTQKVKVRHCKGIEAVVMELLKVQQEEEFCVVSFLHAHAQLLWGFSELHILVPFLYYPEWDPNMMEDGE